MQRISYSTSNVGENVKPSIPNVHDVYQSKLNMEDTYWFTLKLLVLEYINEPRFRAVSSTKQNQPSNVQNASKKSTNENVNNISNGPFNVDINTNYKRIDENEVLQKVLSILEAYLRDLAIKRNSINDTSIRRSLLKFYNDMYLNPNLSGILKAISRFEEVIIYFTKIANVELNKIEIENVQTELYHQVSQFINLLIKFLPKNIDRTFQNRLENYKDSIISKGPSTTTEKIQPNFRSISNTNVNQKVRSPTFKLSEITHSTLFMELFNVDEMKLQHDVVKMINEATNDIFGHNLKCLKNKILEGHWMFSSDDFSSHQEYLHWQEYELREIDALLNKYKVNHDNKTVSSNNNAIIPSNPRDIFVNLVSLVLLNEKHNRSRDAYTLDLSQDSMFFIIRSAKCWILDYPSTLASLFYSAANLSVLNDSEISVPLAECINTLLYKRILKSVELLSSSTWNNVDQKEWIMNIFFTSNQCLESINSLLSSLFSNIKPKFSPVLVFYYSYIESDEALQKYKLYDNSDERRWVKTIRKTLFITSETYYITLLSNIPKDRNIQIKHIQDVAEHIIEQIKSIQNKYKKPLLDRVNITMESAIVLVEAISSDIPLIMQRIEKYNDYIAPTDALEVYSVFKELRNIHYQIKPRKHFPFKLEKLFVKYLIELCDSVSETIVHVICESLENEQWKRINDYTSYSSSVFDIFKMINESINIFDNIEWEDDYQIAKIKTFLLKSFADGLHIYSISLLQLVEDDLLKETEEYQFHVEGVKEANTLSKTALEKKSSTWLFDGMKNVLAFKSIEIPKPYEYNPRTCVILNDLDAMVSKINDLSEHCKAEEISKEISSCEREKNKNITGQITLEMHYIYTIRIISAENIKGFNSEGLSNVSLSLINTSERKEIAKTKVIRKTVDPSWDEEFELEQTTNTPCSIVINVWHHPTGALKNLNKYEICGKSTLILDPRKFPSDGFPNDVILDLDTQGRVYLQVSLENEKLDALFSIGRAYRTLTRARDRAIEQIIYKFSEFIDYTFSRVTLKTICGNNKNNAPSREIVYDVMIPLFDYLNANLNILASELTEQLLNKVILRAWAQILRVAESLVLPSLNLAKRTRTMGPTKKKYWNGAVNAALGNTEYIPGYGKALSQSEFEVIYIWLNALCVDFFYNGGEGPPLEDLKNEAYQRLLLIAAYYDKNVGELKAEVGRLSPGYKKYLDQNVFGDQSRNHLSKRLTTVARHKTIMANASGKKRKEVEIQIKIELSDPLERLSETLDIVLRCLLAKGQIEYVQKHLEQRAMLRKELTTQRLVDAAIRGQRLK